MPRRLPPLNALRAFDAAGRHGSFSRAAQELSVTHAAISRHVRGLERRLGTQLLTTVTRGVELTEAGAKYLAVVAPALDRIAEATEELSASIEGLVSVSAESTFALKWLMPRLGDFQDRYPDVELRIDSSTRLVDIQHHEFDLAIRYSRRRRWDGLQSDELSRSTMYPVGAPRLWPADWPPEGPPPDDPRRLSTLRLLQEDDGAAWRAWFALAGVPDVRVPRAPGPLASVLAIEGALAGQGLALGSDELIADDLKSNRLVRFSQTGMEYGGYALLYLPETGRRKAVRAFRDWLLDATRPLRPAP
jgi:DNA-binding transcriptional LysR family regulator